MKHGIAAQVAFRGAYLSVALIALLCNIGLIGGETFSFRAFFFTDFFNWALVMSIIATAGALAENMSAAKAGENRFPKKFALLRFCTACSMLFCFLLGAFFLDRVGNHRLTDSESYGSVFPGMFTAGYWSNVAVVLPRFVAPVMYFISFLLFEERGKTRGIYSTIAILPPTVFYFFDLFFGMIMSAACGGTEGLLEKGLYGVAYPYFFQDSALTFTGWYWMLLWPTIFGVSLMILNNIVFTISRISRNADGKFVVDRKSKPDESELCDCLHGIAVRHAAKKAAKNADKTDGNGFGDESK